MSHLPVSSWGRLRSRDDGGCLESIGSIHLDVWIFHWGRQRWRPKWHIICRHCILNKFNRSCSLHGQEFFIRWAEEFMQLVYLVLLELDL